MTHIQNTKVGLVMEHLANMLEILLPPDELFF